MKRALFLLALLLGGIATGGASAFAVSLLHPAAAAAEPRTANAKVEEEMPEFIPTDLLLPLVFGDGQLAGYCTVKLQLRVAPGTGEEVKARLPLLLNALNLTTYRTPLATGPDGRLPDLTALRSLVQRSADQSLGKGTILQVAITEARTS